MVLADVEEEEIALEVLPRFSLLLLLFSHKARLSQLSSIYRRFTFLLHTSTRISHVHTC